MLKCNIINTQMCVNESCIPFIYLFMCVLQGIIISTGFELPIPPEGVEMSQKHLHCCWHPSVQGMLCGLPGPSSTLSTPTPILPGPPSCQDPHPDTQLCPGKIPMATSAAPLGLDLQGKQETPSLLFQFTDTRTVLKNLKKIPTNTINHQILLKPTYKNFKRVFM